MPKVSVGLPVFNGERYLAAALTSALGQTYQDFELIICDNHSNDDTQRICEAYAERDPRVRYYRNPTNIGAGPNFNRTFELAKGEYFRWAAHDDLCAPEYLEDCVRVLDRETSVVLVHSEVEFIDDRGKFLRHYTAPLPNINSTRPRDRFRDLISLYHLCFDIFGLIRADLLRKTDLIASYIGSDRSLLAELGLHGRFCRVPRVLFFSRDHSGRSIRSMELHERGEWFDPALRGNIALPNFRAVWEFGKSVHRVPISAGERWSCYAALLLWLVEYRRFLWRDLKTAVRTVRRHGWPRPSRTP